MKTLELFAGTKSFSKVAEKLGHITFTTDIDPQFDCDWTGDILQFDTKEIFYGKPDIIWASPPCTAFSVASIGSSWCGYYCPKRVESALGIAYVLKTLEIIKKLKPKYWFIENPRGVLRKMHFMKDLPRNTVTYCQYGDTRMKPTDIWTNCADWKPKPMCKNGDSCHVAAPRGSKTGTQGLAGAMERSVIPPALFEEIFSDLTLV